MRANNGIGITCLSRHLENKDDRRFVRDVFLSGARLECTERKISGWVMFLKKQDSLRDALLRRMPTNSVCAEIGAWKGDFSARILKIVQPARLHLVDPWKYEDSATYEHAWYGGSVGSNQAHMDRVHNSVVARFRKQIDAGVVVVHRSSSTGASAGFPDEYFDWVYIDGNHLYECVKADLNNFYPKVKYGGFITGDDYDRKGWWDDGVTKAVDEFRDRCKTVLIQSSQFVLQKV